MSAEPKASVSQPIADYHTSTLQIPTKQSRLYQHKKSAKSPGNPEPCTDVVLDYPISDTFYRRRIMGKSSSLIDSSQRINPANRISHLRTEIHPLLAPPGRRHPPPRLAESPRNTKSTNYPKPAFSTNHTTYTAVKHSFPAERCKDENVKKLSGSTLDIPAACLVQTIAEFSMFPRETPCTLWLKESPACSPFHHPGKTLPPPPAASPSGLGVL
jgi:hypothetical protein